HVAMLVAERYKTVPSLLRRALVEGPINLFPTSELKRSRVRDAKRFFRAANLPKVERYFRWMSTFDRQAKKDLYTADFASSVGSNNPVRFLDKWFVTANGSGVLDATLLSDMMTYLPNDLLVKVDIASMANSLEARSPLLDHKVIEFAASLPENLKMQRFQTKSLLKKVAAKLVPPEVVYRRKMGFGVPVGKWFREGMKDFVREILLAKESLNRGIVKPDVMRRYVLEHTNGERDHQFQIWTLLMLELWFKRFIDQR
ncbi:MAG TPA: asparagine synthase-related protein, partial [Pyrinomonadaceae bacterium]